MNPSKKDSITLGSSNRHVIFTVPDKLRELFRNPKYQKILFIASKITMEEMIASSNKKSKKKIKLKIGMIQVLQTFGADMKYNPHVHCIVTEGGFDRKWNWIHTYYMPYKFWRKKWQYKLLTMLKKEIDSKKEKAGIWRDTLADMSVSIQGEDTSTGKLNSMKGR